MAVLASRILQTEISGEEIGGKRLAIERIRGGFGEELENGVQSSGSIRHTIQTHSVGSFILEPVGHQPDTTHGPQATWARPNTYETITVSTQLKLCYIPENLLNKSLAKLFSKLFHR